MRGAVSKGGSNASLAVERKEGMEKSKRAVQRRSVADLVSESLIRGNCPVDAVVISTSGKGMTDLSESVEVNVLCKEG
jgi:hypothetical protein